MWFVFTSSFKKRISKLPQRPLTDQDLLEVAKQWKIKYFRGVFSRDTLPKKIRVREKGIVNLDDNLGKGTH